MFSIKDVKLASVNFLTEKLEDEKNGVFRQGQPSLFGNIKNQTFKDDKLQSQLVGNDMELVL